MADMEFYTHTALRVLRAYLTTPENKSRSYATTQTANRLRELNKTWLLDKRWWPNFHTREDMAMF
jgi:hypothetical protein